MLIFKISGAVLVVISSAYIGFLKCNSMCLRHRKLLLFMDGVNTLYNCIKQGEFDLKTAIKNSFSGCEFLLLNNPKIQCNDVDLKKDKALIEDFFITLGHSTKMVECERISIFKLKLKSNINEALNEIEQKGRLYKILGVCVGIVIAIFLI